ncbi:hypothetical protein, partial [Enterococcus sp.]|uniref:hypothetical protein n=1 Tax=Enterococcus sp. TaxID=35783 RepID=UPI00283C287E
SFLLKRYVFNRKKHCRLLNGEGLHIPKEQIYFNEKKKKYSKQTNKKYTILHVLYFFPKKKIKNFLIFLTFI